MKVLVAFFFSVANNATHTEDILLGLECVKQINFLI